MKLLTVKEVAELLRAKPSTIYQWAEQGLMPSLKLNGVRRFDEADVIGWIKNKKIFVEDYNSSASRRPKKGGQN